jgi:hypothetical protein
MLVVTAHPEVFGAAEFAGFAPAANAQASAIRQMFLNTSSKSSGSYALTEVANVAVTG